MKAQSLIGLVLAFWPLAAAAPGWADVARKALFDAVLDFDGDGAADRAVIVVSPPSDADWSTAGGFAYPLQRPGEAVELYLYLGGGAAALDLAKPPSFHAAYLVDEDRFSWVQPLDVTARGSLKLTTAYAPGASDTAEQTLTIAWRHGEPTVVGYTIGWERRDGAGTCDVNLATGKALLFEGLDLSGPAKRLTGQFKPVPLRQWSEQTRPKACDGLG